MDSQWIWTSSWKISGSIPALITMRHLNKKVSASVFSNFIERWFYYIGWRIGAITRISNWSSNWPLIVLQTKKETKVELHNILFKIFKMVREYVWMLITLLFSLKINRCMHHFRKCYHSNIKNAFFYGYNVKL